MTKRTRLYATILAAIAVTPQLAQTQPTQGTHEPGSLARAMDSEVLPPLSLRSSAAIKPALPLVMASLMRVELEPMADPCASVTLDVYDRVYTLLKNARSEAAADVGNPKLPGAPDALQNQNALDGVLAQLQSTRATWLSTYGGGRRVINAAEAYQIFTTLESVIPSINTAQHWAITEASHSAHSPNHGRASFDFESQAIVIANQMRVDAGHCYMLAYE